jgi:hypothetical protein
MTDEEFDEFRSSMEQGIGAIVRTVSWGNIWLFVLVVIELFRLWRGY